MSDQTKPLNLVNAISIINDYIQKTSLITPEEKQFLHQIQARIRAIYVAQRGYTTAGSIEKARYLNHPLTQKDLIDEVLLNQKKSIGFTWITVSQLLQDLAERKANSVNTNFNKVLVDLEKSCSAVLANIKDKIKFKPNSSEIAKIELDENHHKNLEIMGEIMEFFGGRFLPFFQSEDPLAGQEQSYGEAKKSDGHCTGYVGSWSKEIRLKGYASSFLCLDEEVNELQNQDNFIVPTWRCDYYAETDFRQLVDQMLNAMRSDKTYELVLFPRSPRAFGQGHAIGIRHLPFLDAYEMMDPNLGIIVFDDREKFIAFFANYLVRIYFNTLVDRDTVTSDLRLYAYDQQSLDAKPSIPNFTNVMPSHNEDRSQYQPLYTLKEFADRNQIQLKDTNYRDRYGDEIKYYGFMGFNLGSFLAVSMINSTGEVGIPLRFATYLAGGVLGGVGGVRIGMSSNFVRELLERSGNYFTQKLLGVIGFFTKSTTEIKIDEGFANIQKPSAQLNSTANVLLELGPGTMKLEDKNNNEKTLTSSALPTKPLFHPIKPNLLPVESERYDGIQLKPT